MGGYFWVIGRFQVGKVQKYELSVGKTISGIARSKFQWRRGRLSHFWVSTIFDLSFQG
jgi:hypothetical protein